MDPAAPDKVFVDCIVWVLLCTVGSIDLQSYSRATTNRGYHLGKFTGKKAHSLSKNLCKLLTHRFSVQTIRESCMGTKGLVCFNATALGSSDYRRSGSLGPRGRVAQITYDLAQLCWQCS